MPVSSPSYFPPERGNGSIVGITAGANTIGARQFLGGNSAGNNSQVDDLIILGYHAFDAGTVAAPITDTDWNGTIVIGSNAASAATAVLGETRPSVIIGFNACAAAVNIGGAVVIGSGALQAFVGRADVAEGEIQSIVVIGDRALGNVNTVAGAQNPPRQSVAIGQKAFLCTNPLSGLDSSVVLGWEAMADFQGGQCVSNVIIGWRAGQSLGFTNNGTMLFNVLIGANVTPAGRLPIGNVVIGNDCSFSNNGASTTGPDGNVAIGSTMIGIGGDGNTLVGSRQNLGGISRSVVLGAGAGIAAGLASDQFLVETNYASVHRAILFGDLSTGNLIAGKSTATVDRDFDGAASRNILKLLNGTVGALAPVGGGYFYVVAGALHWVGSAGTNTVVAPA